MRRWLFLLLTLLVAALAWLGWRSVRQAEAPGAATGELAPSAEAEEPGALDDQAQATDSRAAPAAVLRFEPLPEEPTEIVVRIVDGVSEQPVLGAEVFALDVDDSEWPLAGLRSEEVHPDAEAELRARGRRLECDAKGELHLSIPSAWLAVMARKDGLYGECVVGFDYAPETTLSLYSSRPCVVRTRDRAGRAVGGVTVVLRRGSGGSFWRGRSDSDGEARIPNLGWIVKEHCREEEESWYATVSDGCLDAPVSLFQLGEPLPSAIELALPDAQRIELQLETSEGARAPIGGCVSVSIRSASGSASALRIPRYTEPYLPLVEGRASLARAEPGSWLECDVWLPGEETFTGSVRVPEAGAAAGQATLRIPEHLQIVLARPSDANGAPLANREFEWVSWAQAPKDDLEQDQHEDTVRSDSQGRLAFAIARSDLFPNEPADPDEPAPELAWRGVLRLREAGQELESAPILFSALGPGASRDLGVLQLAPATPLVRGRVLDERGRPVGHVDVGLEQLRTVDGESERESLAGIEAYGQTRTDAEGAFAIYGSCPGGSLTLRLDRDGHRPPREAPAIRFECGSSADLTLTLVRTGTVHIRARTPRRLAQDMRWVLDDGVDEQEYEMRRAQVNGLLEIEFEDVRPGKCQVRLEAGSRDEEPLLVIEDVPVRSGERTLDPRLCEVDLSRFAAKADAPPPPTPGQDQIVLRIVDRDGRSIPEGRLFYDYGCYSSDSVWRGGCVRLQGNDHSREYTIWSPGFCAWWDTCPERSGELRLEPAWHIGFELEVPGALRRPDRLVRVVTRVISSEFGSSDVMKGIAPAVVGSDGRVRFEVPGPCELEFVVELIALDSSGTAFLMGLEPQAVKEFSMQVPPGDSTSRIEVEPEQWAAAEKVLAEKK